MWNIHLKESSCGTHKITKTHYKLYKVNFFPMSFKVREKYLNFADLPVTLSDVTHIPPGTNFLKAIRASPSFIKEFN